MALLTLAEHKAFVGITTTDPVRDAALTLMIQEAIEAVKQYCKNGEIAATEYTQILDAPAATSLILPYAPVIFRPDDDPAIDFSLYQNDSANGDPSQFTSSNLKTMYTDYMLQTGPNSITVSETGIVRFLSAYGALDYERPIYSLAVKIVPTRGAIKVVYTAGYETIPASLKMALNLIVRKLWNMRKLGLPMQSESLNSYSYSAQGTATANGIIQGDPTIQQALRPFCRPQIGGYY